MDGKEEALRLQPSLKAAAERLAAEEGVSLNQFVNVAVAEKLSAIGTEEYFRERAKRGKREAFLKFLDEAGNSAPAEGDDRREPCSITDRKKGAVLHMKDPAHPGELIGAALDEMGVSISEAARQLGVSRQLLHGIIAGRNPVSLDMAVRLEAGLGSTAETWLRMQTNHDLAQIRQRAAPAEVKRIVPKVA